jgi:large subunit ribosomal protein L22
MAEDAQVGTEWRATHKFARISPRKARLVISLIRGRPCHEALDILRFNHRRASQMIAAVLRSAINNAEQAEANVSRLYVAEARVDGGPYYRRWHPKDRGRAHPIAKRTSHLIVRVAQR